MRESQQRLRASRLITLEGDLVTREEGAFVSGAQLQGAGDPIHHDFPARQHLFLRIPAQSPTPLAADPGHFLATSSNLRHQALAGHYAPRRDPGPVLTRFACHPGSLLLCDFLPHLTKTDLSRGRLM